jgi:hypothetical protein
MRRILTIVVISFQADSLTYTAIRTGKKSVLFIPIKEESE